MLPEIGKPLTEHSQHCVTAHDNMILREKQKKEKVLVVAAHADDELLGCGGTMAKHTDAGDDVAVLFLTDGVGARGKGGANCQDVDLRDDAAKNALAIVGAKLLDRLDFPDNAIDSVPRIELTQAVERVIDTYQPDVVYTHHGGDLNVDHRRALEAVMTACRPQPGSSVSKIYSFEVASSTGWQGETLFNPFVPNHYVEITEQLERKIEALRAYEEEMRAFPHARSIEALKHLARWRGSQVGVVAAEAFVVERQLCRNK